MACVLVDRKYFRAQARLPLKTEASPLKKN